MNVRILEVNDDTGEETYVDACDLHDAIPDDEEYAHAIGELHTSGRYHAGGGAAPHFLLLKA